MLVKKIFTILLCLCLVMCCGCGKNSGGDNQGSANGNNSSDPGRFISLPCNTADSFNPFLATTAVNRQICNLMYDPLVKVNSDFSLNYVLAANIETIGNTCTVTIKNARFSDGTSITADDVVYSFEAAKKCNRKYKYALESVESAVVRDANSVIFTSAKNDPYVANLLNFPIIKTGSDLLTNSDNVYLPPIGSGRYILDTDLQRLTANDGWHSGSIAIKEIRLINTPDSEAIQHAIEIGAIDAYYTDLSNCEIPRMSGTRTQVLLNNLVYVGVNLKKQILSSFYMRHAISSAIDRSNICEDAFFNNALPATGFFNPLFSPVKNIQSIEISSNMKIAIENLGKIGYNRKNNEGYFVNSGDKPLAASILVNEENSFRKNAADMIALNLKNIGISASVVAVPFEQYVSRLESGSFDLYIAEVNITHNMDISPLIVPGGSSAYGIKKDSASDATEDTTEDISVQNIINAFYDGQCGIQDVAATTISGMPIIPICYRTGILFLSNKITANSSASADDIYNSIENWNLK